MTDQPHPPIPPSAIVDPAAEKAQRHLSWTPDQEGNSEGSLASEGSLSAEMSIHSPMYYEFVSYVGSPDGTFEVTVTMQRGDAAVTHAERGVGNDFDSIERTRNLAMGRAEVALSAIA